MEIVRKQVKVAYMGILRDDALKTIVAYEPVWAIGTGKTATNFQAQEVCVAIRQVLKELYDQEVSEEVYVLYGGSVNAANAQELF